MVALKVTDPFIRTGARESSYGQEFAPPVGRIHFCRLPPTISSFCLTPSGGPYIFLCADKPTGGKPTGGTRGSVGCIPTLCNR